MQIAIQNKQKIKLNNFFIYLYIFIMLYSPRIPNTAIDFSVLLNLFLIFFYFIVLNQTLPLIKSIKNIFIFFFILTIYTISLNLWDNSFDNHTDFYFTFRLIRTFIEILGLYIFVILSKINLEKLINIFKILFIIYFLSLVVEFFSEPFKEFLVTFYGKIGTVYRLRGLTTGTTGSSFLLIHMILFYIFLYHRKVFKIAFLIFSLIFMGIFLGRSALIFGLFMIGLYFIYYFKVYKRGWFFLGSFILLFFASFNISDIPYIARDTVDNIVSQYDKNLAHTLSAITIRQLSFLDPNNGYTITVMESLGTHWYLPNNIELLFGNSYRPYTYPLGSPMDMMYHQYIIGVGLIGLVLIFAFYFYILKIIYINRKIDKNIYFWSVYLAFIFILDLIGGYKGTFVFAKQLLHIKFLLLFVIEIEKYRLRAKNVNRQL